MIIIRKEEKQMIQEEDLLKFICQNAEMGRDGIAHVIKITDEPEFRRILETQQTEYQKIYDTADEMLQRRGETPVSSSAMAKMASYVTSSMKTIKDHSPSKIADMMIQGSTMGITKMIKRINEYDGEDEQILDLARKQVKTEQANIEQMKKFL